MPQENASDVSLRTQFDARRRQGQRHRDIAQALGVSEGCLIAAHRRVSDDARLQATELAPDWDALIGALHDLGPVMALTRNAGCVHEVVGRYPALPGSAGRVVGEGFELQLHCTRWARGFGVVEQGVKGGLQRSLQFFAADGQAVHKVVLQPGSMEAAFEPLLARFASTRTTAFEPTPGADPTPVASADTLAASAQTAQCAAGVQRLLEAAARQALALTLRVASPGAEQSRSAPVQRITMLGSWLNVLDPGFNLHLRADRIARADLQASSGPAAPALQVRAADGALLCSVGPAAGTDAARWAALVGCALQECTA